MNSDFKNYSSLISIPKNTNQKFTLLKILQVYNEASG